MNRGFTIVELLVVVSVLAVLVTISAFAYRSVQNEGSDGAASSLASIVRSAAEKQYANNNEYPLASAVQGSTITGLMPSTYAAASTVLGIPLNTLTDSRAKLVACGPSQTACKINNLNTSWVYYFTKSTQTSSTAEVITTVAGGSDCAYTFPSSETGALAYIVAYYSSVDKVWKITKSNNGTVNTSNATTCAFTKL